MWYEILPGFFIICGCVTSIGLGNVLWQRAANGGKLRRVVNSRFEYALLRRDIKLAGMDWKTKGLEALPKVK